MKKWIRTSCSPDHFICSQNEGQWLSYHLAIGLNKRQIYDYWVEMLWFQPIWIHLEGVNTIFSFFKALKPLKQRIHIKSSEKYKDLHKTVKHIQKGAWRSAKIKSPSPEIQDYLFIHLEKLYSHFVLESSIIKEPVMSACSRMALATSEPGYNDLHRTAGTKYIFTFYYAENIG